MRACTERGQSEVVGIVLLIGVVVTLVFGAGMMLFADWQSEIEREQRMDVESDITALGMTLEHMGGASAAADELEIVLQGDVEKRFSLDEFDTASERFEPGDSWDNSFEEVESGIVDVLVIRTDGNTVVHEATYEIGEAGIELVIEDPSIDIGETSDYTAFRTFERAAAENVTGDVDIEILDGEDVIAVDESHAEIIGEEAGEATIQASYEEFTDTASVTVREDEEEAFFAVSIDETNSPVTEGETLEVEVTIENTGDEEATQTLELADFDGNIVNSEDITLDGGESDSSVTLTWDTGEGDAGSDEITVTSDDDEDTEEVTIEEEAFFAVSIDDVDEGVTEGEDVTIEYTVENTGDIENTQDISFSVNDSVEEQELDVSLNGDETFSNKFEYTTNEDDIPAITVTVASDDDEAERTVSVEQQPPNFEITIIEADDVDQGEVVEVVTEVENTGGVEDTQTVSLDVETVGSDKQDAESLTLDGGETTTTTLEWDTGDTGTMSSNPGEYELLVESNDTSDTATTTVRGLEYAVSAADDSTLELAVVNNRTDDVILETVTADDTNNETVEIDTGSIFEPEFLVDVTGDLAADYSATCVEFNIDPNCAYSIGEEIPLSGSEAFDSDTESVWNILEFRNEDSSPVDMSDTHVTITIQYQDADGASHTSEISFQVGEDSESG